MANHDELFQPERVDEQVEQLTGIQEKTALVRAGLQALIAREAGKRLAALGGSQPASNQRRFSM